MNMLFIIKLKILVLSKWSYIILQLWLTLIVECRKLSLFDHVVFKLLLIALHPTISSIHPFKGSQANQQGINTHTLPIYVSKLGEVSFSIQSFLMFHQEFTNKKIQDMKMKMKQEKTNQITSTYLESRTTMM